MATSRRQKIRSAKRSAKVKAMLGGRSAKEIKQAGKAAKRTKKADLNAADRRSAMRGAVKGAVKKSVKKSFKSGKAKGAISTTSSRGMNYGAGVSRKSVIAKGAAAAGRGAYKLTAARKAALKKAQQASARVRRKR